jgi:GrpB-like predicted nucleotidyltransferase (UPF0157 family)
MKVVKKIIRYNKPDNRFKLLFDKEKSKLKKILPKSARIEHVGSTAVPKLGGKNFVDIFIAVPSKQLSISKKKLQKNGYEYDSKWKKRMFFIKKYGAILRFNIHLLPSKDTEFSDAILLRDYLRNNKQAIRDYIKHKKEAIKVSKVDWEKYREYKHPFMVKMIDEARKAS